MSYFSNGSVDFGVHIIKVRLSGTQEFHDDSQTLYFYPAAIQKWSLPIAKTLLLLRCCDHLQLEVTVIARTSASVSIFILGSYSW